MTTAEKIAAQAVTRAVTYPARPIKGGPPKLARYKSGYAFEPKYNGWRVLVHTPSMMTFNRHGEPLSIGKEFLPAMLRLNLTPFRWLDCEGLSRRHGIAKGALIVLDWVEQDMPYEFRRSFLCTTFRTATIGFENVMADGVYVTPSFPSDDEHPHVIASICDTLEHANRKLGCTFYEGIVAKKQDTRYPMQLRSPDEETPHWIKHRFTTS